MDQNDRDEGTRGHAENVKTDSDLMSEVAAERKQLLDIHGPPSTLGPQSNSSPVHKQSFIVPGHNLYGNINHDLTPYCTDT